MIQNLCLCHKSPDPCIPILNPEYHEYRYRIIGSRERGALLHPEIKGSILSNSGRLGLQAVATHLIPTPLYRRRFLQGTTVGCGQYGETLLIKEGGTRGLAGAAPSPDNIGEHTFVDCFINPNRERF